MVTAYSVCAPPFLLARYIALTVNETATIYIVRPIPSCTACRPV